MTNQRLKIALLKDWPSRLVLTFLTIFSGIVWSQGKQFMETKIIEIVRPSLDTLAKKQEATDQKVEAVQDDVAKLNDKLDALISVLVESSPEIKKSAQSRIQKNRDSQDVKDALTGKVK